MRAVLNAHLRRHVQLDDHSATDASSQRSTDAILAAEAQRRGWNDLQKDPSSDNRDSTPHLFTPSGLASQLLCASIPNSATYASSNMWNICVGWVSLSHS